MMTKTLQQMFVDSKGGPVFVGTKKVIQMDRIPVASSNVTVQLLGKMTGIHGVRLKTRRGEISFSDGSTGKSVCIWADPSLPSTVMYHVDTMDAELRVWNVYRTKHLTGEVTVDSWTGNAGMTIEYEAENLRRYGCSAGPGSFDPHEFKLQISWDDGRG
jgi:hypothetical protein